MLYVKGGAAVVSDKYDSFLTAPMVPLPTGFITDRGSETRWGGVVGIGGEFSFTRNWSLAVEYDHLFMGTRDVFMTYDPFFIAALNHSEHIRQDVDMVKTTASVGPWLRSIEVRRRFGAAVARRRSCPRAQRTPQSQRLVLTWRPDSFDVCFSRVGRASNLSGFWARLRHARHQFAVEFCVFRSSGGTHVQPRAYPILVFDW